MADPDRDKTEQALYARIMELEYFVERVYQSAWSSPLRREAGELLGKQGEYDYGDQ